MLLNVEPSGTIRFIHTDDLAPLLQEGTPTISRASHVEPNSDGTWSADMSPVGGPVLGPFTLRGDALSAEVAWIERHVFGAVLR